jgi:hypothetical protein
MHDPEWISLLGRNPVPLLLAQDDEALTCYVHRDLLSEADRSVQSLWETRDAIALVKKQHADGSWHYAGKPYNATTGTNYNLLETYRSLRILVEMYGFNIDHFAIQKAAAYVFSCQTGEGDIRGILGNQYMPYYHGAILELLIKAGLTEDWRVAKGLEWLLSVRQDDGGWLVPAQSVPAREKTSGFWLGMPLSPPRVKPSSHLATGMALRAFAAHPDYRHHPGAHSAGDLLANRLFQGDRYNDRKSPSYWLKFQFPFWWTSLLTALDTLFWLGFDRDNRRIRSGLEWFRDNQSADGLWEDGYGSGKGAARMRCWVGLAICRMLKNYYPSD